MAPFTSLTAKTAKIEAAIHAQEEAPELERVDWAKSPGLRKLYFYSFILCIASATTGYDGMFLNSVQNFDSWQVFFHHPTGSRLGFLGALYMIGSVISIPVVPFICDKWGRKLPIVIGCVIMTVGAVVQGSCHNLGTFMAGRALLGFGNSFAQMASPMLLAELAHPQHRARVTTFYNCEWYIGAFIVAWLSFGTDYLYNNWSWRIPALGQAIPSVIQLIFVWWIPESPRFLIAQDRSDEALQILAKYHADGNINDVTVQFEYREIRQTLALEMAANRSSSFLDFLRTKGNRHRLLIIVTASVFAMWSGNAIISVYTNLLYEQAGITSSTARLGLGGGLTVVSFIAALFMATRVDRFGRRPSFLVSTGGMFGTFVFWTLTAGLYEDYNAKGANIAMIIFIWIFNIFYSLAWTGLLVSYPVEILPYNLRAKGMMISSLTIQVALLLNTYANPVAFKGFGNQSWKLYLIYTCWIIVEFVVVYLFYVETKGPTLEEILKIFDGDTVEFDQLDVQQMQKEAEIAVHAENIQQERVNVKS